jgi:hypothetical protein
VSIAGVVHQIHVSRIALGAALGRGIWNEREIARANTVEIVVDQNVHNAKILPSFAIGVGKGEGERLTGSDAGGRSGRYRLGGYWASAAIGAKRKNNGQNTFRFLSRMWLNASPKILSRQDLFIIVVKCRWFHGKYPVISALNCDRESC